MKILKKLNSKPFLGNAFRKGKAKLLIQKGIGSSTVENNFIRQTWEVNL